MVSTPPCWCPHQIFLSPPAHTLLLRLLPALLIGFLKKQSPFSALAPGAIVHDFVREDVAIDAEEAMAGAAFVAAAFAHAVGDDMSPPCYPGCCRRRARGGSVLVRGRRNASVNRFRVVRLFGGSVVRQKGRGILGPGRSFGWEGRLAAEAGALIGSVGSLPGDFGPVLEGKEMVVATREVGAQDQGEFAGWASGGERAHFAAAARAEVAAACGAGVAGAQRRHAIDNARGKTHHEKGRLDR